jgi:putative glutamine amidotransferase
MVNSVHHQAVKTLGPDLRVSALAPDGIVEMIEHKDPAYFCFGIQSHPEAEAQNFGEALFAEFVQAVKHYTSNITLYANVRN